DALARAITKGPDQAFLADPSLQNRRLILDWLADTVDLANTAIFAASQENEKVRGMGCTLDAVVVRGRGVFIAHVGDSRVYVLRKGELTQLTDDHTLGQQLLAGGRITSEEVERHPHRNVLVRALGVFVKVEIDTL